MSDCEDQLPDEHACEKINTTFDTSKRNLLSTKREFENDICLENTTFHPKSTHSREERKEDINIQVRKKISAKNLCTIDNVP